VIRVRAIDPDELAWFSALGATGSDADAMAEQLRGLWTDGSGRPEWTLVAEVGGRPVGRGALFTEPLGCGLDTSEAKLASLWLDWSHPGVEVAGVALLDAAAGLALPAARSLERRLNPEVHDRIPEWRRVLAAAGFGLFQEKEGFVWTDAGQPLPPPSRLQLRALEEVGTEAFADAMAAGIAGTLDRNDRYYLEVCGPGAWGRQMVEFVEPGDEASWLLGYEPDGMLAGYVALGPFEPGVGTIVHIGVVPERRGRGYVDDLLAAANRAARTRGHRSILSDVDTLNAPMLAAMERADHRPGVRPWHVWSYRRDLTDAPAASV
jgi:ribosomal protein S18 acetylase RimI-like enzyme